MTDDKLKRGNELRSLIGEFRLIEDSAQGRLENYLGVPDEMFERWREEALAWCRAEIAKAQAEFDAL